MAGANLELAEHERAVNPGAFNDVGNVWRKIRDRGRATREFVERGYEIARDLGWVQLEMFDDAMDVGVLRLQQLMQPMDGFDVRVATHLAKDRGAFDSLVGNGVKFAEEGGASDFSHSNRFCVGWILEGPPTVHNAFLLSINVY